MPWSCGISLRPCAFALKILLIELLPIPFGEKAISRLRRPSARLLGLDVTPRDYDASGVTQPEGLKTRSVEAGFLGSIASGRLGLGNNSPPQLGHVPASFVSVHSEQKVHSKEQILASVESGGRSRLQHSHPGLSWSMADSCFLEGSVLAGMASPR